MLGSPETDTRVDRSVLGPRVRMLAALLFGTGLGFASAWLLREPTTPSAAAAPARQQPRRVQSPLLPRRSLAEQNTVLVGEGPDAPEVEELDGQVVLRPSDLPRVLTYGADDVDAAKAAVERFVAALRSDLVKARAPGEVQVDAVRVLWRIEGEGTERLLRVVAVPTDPYGSESWASRIAEALGEWTIVNGSYPTTVTRFEGQSAAVTSIHAPRTKMKMGVFDAAEAEFRARGMKLVETEVAQGGVYESAHDADGRLLWSFFWSEDQGPGIYGIYHHADPFDTAGEQELLLAIFRRALGRDVRILLNGFR